MNMELRYYYPLKDSLSTNILQEIFLLNEINKPALGELRDVDHLNELYKFSLFCVCCYLENKLISFALVMNSQSDYQSPNYQYFKKKFPEFLYVDRIAVDDDYQRIGVGSLIYKKLSFLAKENNQPLCCEVNTVPLNKQSLDFHSKNKFKIIDEIEFGEKTVAMLCKSNY